MRYLLDFLYLLAAPAIAVCLLVPSRLFTRRRYRAGAGEKLLGPDRRPPGRPCLWIHAVSVGEVRTSFALLRELAASFPGWDLVVSTSTDTGHEVACRGLGSAAPGARLVYAPLDLSWSVERAFSALRPDAVVLVELELWPNFLLAARRHRVPVFVVNGRLTERSASRYLAAGGLGRALFSLLTACAVQNETYAQRFRSLGVDGRRLAILGNLKYDADPGEVPEPRDSLETLHWPDVATGFIVVAGCTHPGEESEVLGAARSWIERYPHLRLVLAPRHIERAGEVVDEAIRAGIGPVARWGEILASMNRGGGQACRILVVDRVGELDRFYALADVVFMGGTLVPHGGHNLLEPARHGKAVVLGPSIDNFEDIERHLRSRRALVGVGDARELGDEVARLLADPPGRRELGERARQAALELQGAVARHVEWLREWLTPGGGADLGGAGRGGRARGV